MAYFRSGMINACEDGVLYDAVYDQSNNGHITLSYIDGAFSSTFRVHVGNSQHAVLPSLAVFPDAIRPRLLAGLTVVDPTRLAARLDSAVKHPELPYVALRPAWLACEHFGADWTLATVAVDHVQFYRRVFGYVELTEPRDYPCLTFKVVCLGLDFEQAKADVEDRYPFFRSTRAEREALFGPKPAVVRSSSGEKARDGAPERLQAAG